MTVKSIASHVPLIWYAYKPFLSVHLTFHLKVHIQKGMVLNFLKYSNVLSH